MSVQLSYMAHPAAAAAASAPVARSRSHGHGHACGGGGDNETKEWRQWQWQRQRQWQRQPVLSGAAMRLFAVAAVVAASGTQPLALGLTTNDWQMRASRGGGEPEQQHHNHNELHHHRHPQNHHRHRHHHVQEQHDYDSQKQQQQQQQQQEQQQQQQLQQQQQHQHQQHQQQQEEQDDLLWEGRHAWTQGSAEVNVGATSREVKWEDSQIGQVGDSWQVRREGAPALAGITVAGKDLQQPTGSGQDVQDEGRVKSGMRGILSDETASMGVEMAVSKSGQGEGDSRAASTTETGGNRDDSDAAMATAKDDEEEREEEEAAGRESEEEGRGSWECGRNMSKGEGDAEAAAEEEEEVEEVEKPLRVYVYDMHQKFHFGLFHQKDLDLLPHTATEVKVRYTRRSQGGMMGLGFEHSAELFMAYNLLLDTPPGNRSLTHNTEVLRVDDPEAADVFFVPYLASLSFDVFTHNGMHTDMAKLDGQLQDEVLAMLMRSPWWQRSGGRDHILPAMQPNALRFILTKLANATFLVADFGRYPQAVARLSKDVVVPYNHILPTFDEPSSDAAAHTSWQRRTTLLYFQGTLNRKNEGYIRKQMYEVLKHEPDVHFVESKGTSQGIVESTEGMRRAKFCLHAAGDTPSSCRLFDAIVSHCVPVVVSNKLELPFESAIDYKRFAVFFSHEDALRKGHIASVLRGISEAKWTAMWRRLLRVKGRFEFQYPSVRGDGVSMIWRQIRYKLPAIRRAANQHRRLTAWTKHK